MAPKRKSTASSDAKEEPKRTRSSKKDAGDAKAEDAKPQQRKGTGAESPKKDTKKAEPKQTGKKKGGDKIETVSDPKEVPPGVKRDSRGRLTFDGFSDFKPTLTPKQVIQAGSFGGIYFNPLGGKKSVKYPKGVDISADEFPKDWFQGLKDEQYKGTRYNVKLNKYGVKSGQNQEQWEEQGWIRDQDPRGWFQWYCRFIQGRRTDDDERQISRWVGVAGPKGRWKTRLVNQVKDKGGVSHLLDPSISPVIRQNLLHWAYELTEEDFKALAKGDK